MFKKIKKMREESEGFDNACIALRYISIAAFCFYVFFAFLTGMVEANKPNECRIKSVYDVMVAAPYALGCVLNKDRFDIKLN